MYVLLYKKKTGHKEDYDFIEKIENSDRPVFENVEQGQFIKNII